MHTITLVNRHKKGRLRGPFGFTKRTVQVAVSLLLQLLYWIVPVSVTPEYVENARALT
jgi:hypothetical protein